MSLNWRVHSMHLKPCNRRFLWTMETIEYTKKNWLWAKSTAISLPICQLVQSNHTWWPLHKCLETGALSSRQQKREQALPGSAEGTCRRAWGGHRCWRRGDPASPTAMAPIPGALEHGPSSEDALRSASTWKCDRKG